MNDYKIILKSVNNIKKLLKGTFMDYLDAEPIKIDLNVIQFA